MNEKISLVLGMIIGAVIVLGSVGFATYYIRDNEQPYIEPEVNEPPIINWAHPDNELSPLVKYIRWTILAADVSDPDGDNMEITFWFKKTNAESWEVLDVFHGHDGVYKTILNPTPLAAAVLMKYDWKLEVDDGTHIVTKEYSFSSSYGYVK